MALVRTLIENVRVVRPGLGVRRGGVAIEGGRVASVFEEEGGDAPASTERIDAGGRLLTPGLIDVHTHGVGRHAYEMGPEHLVEAARILPRFGVTGVCPTVIPNPGTPKLLEKLDALSRTIAEVEGVLIPGLHLEGPFVAIGGAACDPTPGDLTLLGELLDACHGRVAAMSVAPEMPGVVPVIERLVESGIVPFVTHTRAKVAESKAAIEAGARHATHFYDVFPVPGDADGGVRPVGAVEALLADPRCTVDYICDGVHVDPTAIELGLRVKGWQGVVLITDSNIGAGLPEGVYDTPWGFSVKVSASTGARNADPDHPKYGRLAGSALTMDAGINNLHRWFGLPLDQTLAMGSLNPARLLGLADRGRIERGAWADLVLWDQTDGGMRPVRTWFSGRCVWQGEDVGASAPGGGERSGGVGK